MSDERRRIAEEKARLERERLELERRELDLERRENEAQRRALEARERAVEGRAPPPEPGKGRGDESGQMSFRNILARRDVIINVVTGGGVIVGLTVVLSLAVGYFSDVGGIAVGFMMIAAFIGSIGIISATVYRSVHGMITSGMLSSVAMMQASATSGSSVGVAAVFAVFFGVTLGEALGDAAEPNGGAAYASYRFIPNVVMQAEERVRKSRRTEACGLGFEVGEGGECIRKCGRKEFLSDEGECECKAEYVRVDGKCVKPGCDDGMEKVGDECVRECGVNERRLSGGGCGCIGGYEKVEGECVKKCGGNEKRVSRVACEKVPEEENRCPKGMAFIAGGSFGGHTVGDFCMDITEVTVAAFGDSVTEANKRSDYCNAKHSDRGRHPMNCVGVYAAKAHCEARDKRLPTEWEWEWAARGREEGREHPWGDAAPTCRLAVTAGCGSSTAKVGSKSPAGDTRDGLKDMSGNVWEWTSTSEEGKYRPRGHGWYDYLSALGPDSLLPVYDTVDGGFRCARTAR
jgi:hypothetical protein